MQIIYFEVTKSELANIGEKTLVDLFLRMCARTYKTGELEVLISVSVDGKVRHICCEISASNSDKVREIFIAKEAYKHCEIISCSLLN